MSAKSPAPAPVIPTPHILHFFLFITALAALIFYLLSRSVIVEAQHAAQTIGKDSVPSIVAAEEIRKALADANTNAVKALLSSDLDARRATDQYNADLAIVSDRLIAAAENIKPEYGEEERLPIVKMAQALPRYAAQIAQARGADTQTNAVNLRAAIKLSQTDILSAAEALDQANFRHLNDEYYANNSGTTTKCAEVICAGLLLLAILCGIQFSLLARFHRILNLPLVGATVLLLVTSVWLVYSLYAAQASLQTAKEGAFDTIHTLWKIRAAKFEADTDMALWLLDSTASDYERAFNTKSSGMAAVAVTDMLIEKLERENYPFDGLLGDAFRKAKFFPNEHSRMVWMMRYHKNYLDAAAQIRDLERANKHAQAVALWIGAHEGESAWALDKFDMAVANLLSLNQNEFTGAVMLANEQFSAFGYFLPGSVLMILFLAWVGLRPRIKEYA